jgi:multidrug resistance protein
VQKKQSLILFTWVLILYEVACYLSMDAYVPALPSIADDFNISHSFAQLTIAVWLGGGVIIQPIIGPLAERFGRRPILLIGGVCFVCATFLCLLSTNIYMLLVARTLQGMAVPSMIIAGYAAIHESFDKIEAIHTLGRMQSVTLLAPALGPLLGGVLLVFMHWPWLFGLLGLLSGVAISFLFFIMPETLAVEKRPKTINIKDIMAQYYRALKNSAFMRYALSVSALVGTLVAWITASPILIIDYFHYDTVHFGVFQGVVFGCFLLGNRITKVMLKEGNLHAFTVLGLTLLMIGSGAGIVLSYSLPNLLFGLIGSMMLVALGAGISFPILLRLTIESSDEPMGIRMGVLTIIQMAMATLGSLMVVIFFTGTLLSLACVVACFPVLALLATLLKKQS